VTTNKVVLISECPVALALPFAGHLMHISTFTQKKKRKEKKRGGLSSPCTSAAQFSEETGPSVVIIIC
jgi:hypothetical protein